MNSTKLVVPRRVELTARQIIVSLIIFYQKNLRQGLRSLNNLILHSTTRTDDSHAVPSNNSFDTKRKPKRMLLLYTLVRSHVDYRIKPHAPPFIQTPANLFKFCLCSLTPQARHLRVSLHTGNTIPT